MTKCIMASVFSFRAHSFSECVCIEKLPFYAVRPGVEGSTKKDPVMFASLADMAEARRRKAIPRFSGRRGALAGEAR